MPVVELTELLDVYFEGLGVAEAQREVAGGKTWRASLIGSCLRRQYLDLVDHVPTKPIDARTQRIFQVGHLTGTLIERAFEKLGVLIEAEMVLTDDEWDIGAHVDFLIGGPVTQGGDDPVSVLVRERVLQKYGPVLPVIGVELKSKSSRSFWNNTRRGEAVAGDNQLIQAATYDLLARKQALQVDRWAVLSVSKDDLTMVEDEVQPRHREEAERRLGLLKAAQSYQDVPCSCFTDFRGSGWKYCPYGVSKTECC